MDIGKKSMGRLREWQLESVNECQENHGSVEEEHGREVGSTRLTGFPAILSRPHTLQYSANQAIGEENEQRV